MPNPFDEFDAPVTSPSQPRSNPFDEFDATPAPAVKPGVPIQDALNSWLRPGQTSPVISAAPTPDSMTAAMELRQTLPPSPTLSAPEQTPEARISRFSEALAQKLPFFKDPSANLNKMRAELSSLDPATPYWEMSPAEIADKHSGLKERIFGLSAPPSKPLPQWDTEDVRGLFPPGEAPSDTALSVVAGGERAAVDLVDFFRTPLGMATLASGGVLGAAGGTSAAVTAGGLERGIAAKFAGDMIASAPDQAEELIRAIKSGDKAAITHAALNAAGTLAFTHGLTKHALTPKAEVPPSPIPPIIRDVPQVEKSAESIPPPVVGEPPPIATEVSAPTANDTLAVERTVSQSSDNSGLGAGAATTPAVEPLKVTAPAAEPSTPEPPVAKPATVATQRRADAAQFTARLKEYGEQLGFIQRPDDVHGWTGGDSKSGQSGASVKGKVAHDKEMAAAKRRAIKELGGDVDKPDFAALNAELEKRITAHEAEQAKAQEAEMGVETPLTGNESTEFLPESVRTAENASNQATSPIPANETRAVTEMQSGKQASTTSPKLGAAEKGTGDILKTQTEPEGFKLTGEDAVDQDRIAAEKAKAEADKAEAAKNQTEFTGMGGAVPGEFAAGQGNPTAMKFRRIDAERQQRGLPPVSKPESVADQVTLDRAMAAIDHDASLPERLVAELNENPRAIEDWENHVLLLRKIDLRNEYERSARDAAQAYEDGRMDDMNDANARTGEWSRKLSELENASRVSGSARGRALRSLRVMANEDMSLAALEMRARADKGGAPISAEERAELAKVADEYKTKADALEKHLAEKEQKISAMEASATIAEIQRKAAADKAPSAAIIKIAEQWVSKLDARADAARLRLKERLGRTSAGVDPSILVDLAEIGASHIGHIGLDFAKWSDRMIADVGEWVKPHLEQAWAASQKSVESLGIPEAAKKVIKKTKDTVADITGKIKAKVDGGTPNEIAGLVQNLARRFVESGIRDREALIDAVHSELKTVAPEITRRDTMDAISGYGKFKQLSKEEIDVALRDLKGQMQQVGKLQDMQEGKAPSKTGVERRTPSDEERRLIQQVEAAKKKGGYTVTDPAKQLKSSLDAVKTRLRNQIADLEHQISTREKIVKEKRDLPKDAEANALIARRDALKTEYDGIFGKKELTDAQRIEAAMRSVQKSINEYERRIEAGELTTPKKPSKTPETPELLSARAWREALREHLQELRDLATPKKTPEQIALQGFKTRTANRIAEMHDRIAREDFAPKAKRKVVMDPEANRLQAEKEQVQVKYQRARENKAWRDSSVFQKTTHTLGNVYDAARMLMTTGEFSFVLRQGKFNALSHPLRTARAIPEAIRAMRSETRARAIDLQILNHPEMPKARADKLAIIDEHAPLSRQEELIMGRWSNVIPVVSAFNRAARVFLNKVRFDTWMAMRKAAGPSLGKDGGKAIAAYVNESTGRGTLGKAGEPAAVFLSRILFSPRYLASRIQYATGHSLFMPSNLKTRTVIATEYAKTLVGLGLYYAMLNWYFSKDGKKPSVETDARSSDFGKVKLGDTRIDPLAGVAQIATFGKRTVSGETKNARGQVFPIRQKGGVKVPFGRDNWADVAANFGRSKLHPVPAAIANLFSGTDLAGNVVTPEGEAVKLAAPLTYVDVYQALKQQDLSDAAAMSLLAFLGEGLQTYKAKK